jgi:sporulation protein YlmC with PRC-barrel domain
MLVGIDDLHLDIKREDIYTGIIQPVKVFYMLVGIDDLHLDIKREGIYTVILQPDNVFISKCRSPMPTNM